MVFNFKDTMPIVKALGNSNLKDIHWDEIKQVLDTDFPLEDKENLDLTLGKLIDMGVSEYVDEITLISVTAT